jgi:hypothetical protein
VRDTWLYLKSVCESSKEKVKRIICRIPVYRVCVLLASQHIKNNTSDWSNLHNVNEITVWCILSHRSPHISFFSVTNYMSYAKIRIAEEKSFYLKERCYIYLLKIQMCGYGTDERTITTTTTTTTTNITTVTSTDYLFSLAR